jgi:hypothetical protein
MKMALMGQINICASIFVAAAKLPYRTWNA